MPGQCSIGVMGMRHFLKESQTDRYPITNNGTFKWGVKFTSSNHCVCRSLTGFYHQRSGNVMEYIIYTLSIPLISPTVMVLMAKKMFDNSGSLSFLWFDLIMSGHYPLVNKQFAIENGHRHSGFTH